MGTQHWALLPLHKLPIQIVDGDRSAKYPKRDDFQTEGVVFLNSTNIVGNRLSLSECNRIPEEKYEAIRKGRTRHLDIVMTTRGSIGKVALVKQRILHRGLINAQMLLIRADAKTVDPTFLFYVTCSDRFQGELRNFASGSAQPQIPITDLRQVSVPVPPLPTQRKIATILSAYDDLIENNLWRIKILEMAQNLYCEWFVKFRFPGHQHAR
ncbi:restriction endonuclease subunit S, partial [bacterium]